MSVDPTALVAPVADLMRTVAREVVMKHFRSLAAADIIEKGPNDLVTIADREAEVRLEAGLTAILPQARVIGEEGVAADATILNGIGRGLAWIVDPIDGTNNFAAGRSPFAIMVALVEDGETLAGWILDPVTGRLHHAVKGGGAFLDGTRIQAHASGAPLPLGALSVRFFPPGLREQFLKRMQGRLADIAIPHCAGEQYPRLVSGENDIALFWRAHPWDHAPGALILTEAGGRLRRFDGSDYRIDQTGDGLIAAATPELWERAADILLR